MGLAPGADVASHRGAPCTFVLSALRRSLNSRVPDEWNNEEIRSYGSRPQLGILSLAAVLERIGDSPDIVDANSAYVRFTETSGSSDSAKFAEFLAHSIAESDADIYGFSSICSTYPLTVRVADAVKKLRPNATILFGGPQASVVDVSTLEAFPFVDFVLRGEAELSLPLLVGELESGHRFDQVAGLDLQRRPGSQAQRKCACHAGP